MKVYLTEVQIVLENKTIFGFTENKSSQMKVCMEQVLLSDIQYCIYRQIDRIG